MLGFFAVIDASARARSSSDMSQSIDRHHATNSRTFTGQYALCPDGYVTGINARPDPTLAQRTSSRSANSRPSRKAFPVEGQTLGLRFTLSGSISRDKATACQTFTSGMRRHL